MIRQTVFCRSQNPALTDAVIRANMAGCAYQDRELREQYTDVKNDPQRRNPLRIEQEAILYIDCP